MPGNRYSAMTLAHIETLVLLAIALTLFVWGAGAVMSSPFGTPMSPTLRRPAVGVQRQGQSAAPAPPSSGARQRVALCANYRSGLGTSERREENMGGPLVPGMHQYIVPSRDRAVQDLLTLSLT